MFCCIFYYLKTLNWYPWCSFALLMVEWLNGWSKLVGLTFHIVGRKVNSVWFYLCLVIFVMKWFIFSFFVIYILKIHSYFFLETVFLPFLNISFYFLLILFPSLYISHITTLYLISASSNYLTQELTYTLSALYNVSISIYSHLHVDHFIERYRSLLESSIW